MTAWQRVARLPAARIAERLGLAYEGPCPGGEVGAAYVRYPPTCCERWLCVAERGCDL